MPRNNNKRTQLNVYTTCAIHEMIKKIAALEMVKEPRRPYVLNAVVEKAVVEYARKHYPRLVPKNFAHYTFKRAHRIQPELTP